MSVAIALVIFLLIFGVAIACWIVSWQKHGQGAAPVNPGTHSYVFQSEPYLVFVIAF